jgi:hypothetical protein
MENGFLNASLFNKYFHSFLNNHDIKTRVLLHLPNTRFSLKDILKKIAPNFVLDAVFDYRIRQQKQNALKFAQAHIGETYYCNICEKSSGAFMPDGLHYPVLSELNVIGGGERENCRCPHCLSKDRERLIWHYLKPLLEQKGIHVLHFAPETALKYRFKALSNINYINADINPKHADTVMDITAIPLKDESVDLIICNHVLEHIPDDKLAMSELFRVLKRGGKAILQVPIAEKLEKTIEDINEKNPLQRAERFGQEDHVRIYGYDYYKRLQSVGFEATALAPSVIMHLDLLTKLALNPYEKLMLVSKA